MFHPCCQVRKKVRTLDSSTSLITVHVEGCFSPCALLRACGPAYCLKESNQGAGICPGTGHRISDPQAVIHRQKPSHRGWRALAMKRTGDAFPLVQVSTASLSPISWEREGKAGPWVGGKDKAWLNITNSEILTVLKYAYIYRVLLLLLNIMYVYGFWSICHVYRYQKPLKIGWFIYWT